MLPGARKTPASSSSSASRAAAAFFIAERDVTGSSQCARGGGAGTAPPPGAWLPASASAERLRFTPPGGEERARGSGAGGADPVSQVSTAAALPNRFPPVVGARHPLNRSACGAQCPSSLSHSSGRRPRVPAHLSTQWRTPGSRTAGPCPESRRLRRCSTSQIATSAPFPSPTPTPRAWADRRHTEKLGSLRISPTSGRSPPTRPRDWGGGSPCRPAGAGPTGTLPPGTPSAWVLAPALPSPGSSAGRKRVSLRLKSREGPSLRANAHECEPYTCSLEHPAEKHVFSQPTLEAYRLSSMFVGAIGTRFSS